MFVRCVTKIDRQKFEQSCAIKFYVKLGESATVTYKKLQRTYGEHSLYRAQLFKWNKSFLEGQEQVEYEPSAGRNSTSKTDDNVERVRSLVKSDRRLTLRMISIELNLNQFTFHQILTQDLDKTNFAPRWLQKSSRLRRRPIGGMCVFIFWNALRVSKKSSVAFSQVMNNGFWSTTPRQIVKLGSGILQNLPVPRKRE